MQATQGQAERLKSELFELLERQIELERITQGEIARRLGVKRYNINKIMRRKKSASLEYLLRIAESVGVVFDLTARDMPPKSTVENL